MNSLIVVLIFLGKSLVSSAVGLLLFLVVKIYFRNYDAFTRYLTERLPSVEQGYVKEFLGAPDAQDLDDVDKLVHVLNYWRGKVFRDFLQSFREYGYLYLQLVLFCVCVTIAFGSAQVALPLWVAILWPADLFVLLALRKSVLRALTIAVVSSVTWGMWQGAEEWYIYVGPAVLQTMFMLAAIRLADLSAQGKGWMKEWSPFAAFLVVGMPMIAIECFLGVWLGIFYGQLPIPADEMLIRWFVSDQLALLAAGWYYYFLDRSRFELMFEWKKLIQS